MASLSNSLTVAELEEYCPKSGLRHNVVTVKEFCGRCGQKNPSFVPLPLATELNLGSAHRSTHLAAQVNPTMAPLEVSVPERSNVGRSPAEILRQQGMNRRSRAIVTSPNAGARALSMRSNSATSAVVGQLLNELEVDLTVWNCNYYNAVLSNGLCAKRRITWENFGSSTRIYLKDKPFTTVETHIREDILSQWPQERSQTSFDNQEMSLAHEIHRVNGPVIASINPQEIQTLFELISKFKSVGGVKARRHAIHVVLDNLSPAPNPATPGEIVQNKSRDSVDTNAKAKLTEGKKGKRKEHRKQHDVSVKEFGLLFPACNAKTKCLGVKKNTGTQRDFTDGSCTADESDTKSWMNSPSPDTKPKSGKGKKLKGKGKGKEVSTSIFFEDNTPVKDEPVDEFFTTKASSPLYYKSTDFQTLFLEPKVERGLQPGAPISISSDSDDLPSLEELFANRGVSNGRSNREIHNKSATKQGLEASSRNNPIMKSSDIKLEPKSDPDLGIASYVKPVWKSPPRPSWWSLEASNEELNEDFEAILEEDVAAREQIAARVRVAESSVEMPITERGRDLEHLSGTSKHFGEHTALHHTHTANLQNFDSVKRSQSSSGTATVQKYNSKSPNHSIAFAKATTSTKSTEADNKDQGGNEVVKEEVAAEGSQGENKLSSHDPTTSCKKPTSRKTSHRMYPNVQTRSSKKLSETPPPENESQIGSRSLRSSRKGTGKKA